MKEKAPGLNYVFDKDNATIRKFSVNALPTKIIIDEEAMKNLEVSGFWVGDKSKLTN